MWQKDIDKQQIEVEGQIWNATHLQELESLSRTEKNEALKAVYHFLTEWFSDTPTVNVQTSGSTGTPIG